MWMILTKPKFIARSISVWGIMLLIAVGFSSCGQDSSGSPGGEVTITSVAPLEVAVGDTLTLRGTNFSASGSNRVIFIRQGSETIARPVAASATRLQVVAPDAIGEAAVTVKVGSGAPATSSQGVTITEQKDQMVKQYIRDPHFKKGFKLTPLDPDIVRNQGGFARTYRDTLAFGNDASDPLWRLAQWGSKYSLEGVGPTEADDGSLRYANQGKTVALYPDNSLLLGVNASREYDDARKGGETWPGLFFAQKFSKYGPIAIQKADKIIFSMELQLVKAENKMVPEDYNPDIHTAHTPFHFRVRNKNVHSKDYNKYFYFGIPSYDYRNPTLSSRTGGLNGRDRGGNNLMYNLPNVDVWGSITFNDKKWHRGEVNVKPHIKKALEAAHNIDAFTDTEMSDLKITSMNFGWEVPGTFDVAIKVKNMSLKTVTYNN